MTEFWIKGTYGMVVHANNEDEAIRKVEEALEEVCMDVHIDSIDS